MSREPPQLVWLKMKYTDTIITHQEKYSNIGTAVLVLEKLNSKQQKMCTDKLLPVQK